MSKFDIDFGPWINYGSGNKSDEINKKMQDLIHDVWSPFNGHDMAKVFIFCMAYAYAKKLKPVSPPGNGSMPGSAFDEEMRNYMKIVAISTKKDLDVIINANEVVKICEGYAYAGFPLVYDKIANRDSSIRPEVILESLIQEISSNSIDNDNQKNDSK